MLFSSYSVVNFIRFLCLYVGTLLCGVPNDAACFVALWQTVSNVWQSVRSASAISSQPISWVYVGILRSVRHAFAERSQRVRFLYVTYSHYKSMVFDVQKYGFWGAKRGFLSYKSMVFVF